MFFKLLCLLATLMMAIIIVSCPDGSGPNTGKPGVKTSTGLEVKNSSVNYDLKTRKTTISALVSEDKKPKQGLAVEYTLVCGDPKYGALEIRLSATTDNKGIANVSKVLFGVDANSANRCELYVTLDNERLRLLAGEPLVFKMGTAFDVTYEPHNESKIERCSGNSNVHTVVLDSEGKPDKFFYQADKTAGEKFRVLVLPKKWEGAARTCYLGGSAFVKYNPNAMEDFKPDQLTGCTPNTCWKYELGRGVDSPFTPYDSKNNTPSVVSNRHAWLEKKGDEYRLWY